MWQSREFLQSAGRALMRWWNETGPTLPIQGEAFRGWWSETYAALEGDLWGPSDVLEQLQMYASEARAWWEKGGRKGPPPPMFATRELISTPKLGLSLGLVAGAVALVWLLRRG